MSSLAQSIFTMPDLPEVEPNDFERAARILHRRAGIVLGEHKREMAERTLAMRARAMKLDVVRQYLDQLEQNPQSGQWETRSEEHTSELQSLMRISYAVFCLKKKTEEKKQ